jgi:hypothetical protein
VPFATTIWVCAEAVRPSVVVTVTVTVFVPVCLNTRVKVLPDVVMVSSSLLSLLSISQR